MDAASALAVSNPVVLAAAQGASVPDGTQTSNTAFQAVYQIFSGAQTQGDGQTDPKVSNSRSSKKNDVEDFIATGIAAPILTNNTAWADPLALALPSLGPTVEEATPVQHPQSAKTMTPAPEIATLPKTSYARQMSAATPIPPALSNAFSTTSFTLPDASQPNSEPQTSFNVTNAEVAAPLPAPSVAGDRANTTTPDQGPAGSGQDNGRPRTHAFAGPQVTPSTSARSAATQSAPRRAAPVIDARQAKQTANSPKQASPAPPSEAAPEPDSPRKQVRTRLESQSLKSAATYTQAKVQSVPVEIQQPQIENTQVKIENQNVNQQPKLRASVEDPAPAPEKAAQLVPLAPVRNEDLAFSLNLSETTPTSPSTPATFSSWRDRAPGESANPAAPVHPRSSLPAADPRPQDASTTQPMAPHARSIHRVAEAVSSLVPRTGGLVPGLRMLAANSSPVAVRPAEQLARPAAVASRALAPSLPSLDSRQTSRANETRTLPDGLDLTRNAPLSSSYPDARTLVPPSESAPAAPHSSPQPLDSLHPVPVDAPLPKPGSQILLHLAANDQASASVRITDRAGSVRVSVHAPDPELRTSLRSSLDELTTQLNEQGWRADIVKTPIASLPQLSEGRPDSGSQGQRSFHQQPYSGHGDHHQPQRDRRAPTHWLEEFEQQTSGNTANTGGKT